MPPVLLLHDPRPPFETRRTVRLLHERLDGVTALEVRPHRWRDIRSAALPQSGQPVLVHAFGLRSLVAAVLFARGPIFFSSERFPDRRDIAWLRAAMRYRTIRIVCQSDTERRAWVSGGVPMEGCVLIRPGVSLSTPAEARAAARTRLGYTDADHVVFSPVPAHGNGRTMAVWTSCLANIHDPRIKMLVWTESRFDTLEALRSRLLAPETLQTLPENTPDAGFAAADVILLPPADVVSPTLMAMAMASGRPIASSTTASVCEMLEDRHTALLARGNTAKPLAERVADALADPDLSRQIADRARAEVYEFYLLSRMVNDYRAVYAKAATANESSAAGAVTA